VKNSCDFPVYPAIYTRTGDISPNSNGWTQAPETVYKFTTSDGWIGRLWGRTNCNFTNNALQDCETGYCIGGESCTETGVPPATLAEFNLENDQDYYDVSNVDGFNLPILLTPFNSSCKIGSCSENINLVCPSDLQIKNSHGTVVGCDSACTKFNLPQYCCSENYDTPNVCKPTSYSEVFKNACPAAYSYAYDDPTSLFECESEGYTIEFCPSQTPESFSTATKISLEISLLLLCIVSVLLIL